ncbi:MAG: hypothetical protein HKO65_05365 [Gemmatimonadetes bacterium]|nr:hypothetical protein [Gemmatimonadota bacterium]NNM04512.1 hypothetical protein [Gemmatimonadota bacterium]
MDPKLEAAQRKLTARVMGRPGVTGTAIGERGGKPCLKVYVSERDAGKTLPRTIDGFRVVVEVTGRIRRL